jgi:hypothetical protein
MSALYRKEFLSMERKEIGLDIGRVILRVILKEL